MSGPYVPGWPVGRTIVEVREMTDPELVEQGWEDDHGSGIALIFDDGSILFPSRDEEGNGPGELFGVDPLGAQVMLFPGSVRA